MAKGCDQQHKPLLISMCVHHVAAATHPRQCHQRYQWYSRHLPGQIFIFSSVPHNTTPQILGVRPAKMCDPDKTSIFIN